MPALALCVSLPACKADGDTETAPRRQPSTAGDDAANHDPSPETKPVTPTPPPTAPESARAKVAHGINAFTVSLYARARQPGDFCLSPFSAAMALALVDLGAKGDTKATLDRVLGFADGPADPHAALGAVLAQSEGGGEPFDQYGEKIPPHELIVANSMWAARNYQLDPGFVAEAERNYQAKVERIDVGDPTGSAKQINAWVSHKTRDKIEQLVSPTSIQELTRLIVVNAVYLKARWRDPFTKAQTRPQAFHAEGGSKSQVPMMHQTQYHPYTEDDAVQVLSLPYWSRPDADLSMVVILPRARDGLPAIEASLDLAKLQGWLDGLSTRSEMVEVALPRWKTETTLVLDDPLHAVGLEIMYGPDADFSGISAEEGLHVDTVLQKTFIKVDENGTEAAAATALMMAGAGMPPKPYAFVADHPFLYLIRDAKTGLILFVGRVASASGG